MDHRRMNSSCQIWTGVFQDNLLDKMDRDVDSVHGSCQIWTGVVQDNLIHGIDGSTDCVHGSYQLCTVGLSWWCADQ